MVAPKKANQCNQKEPDVGNVDPSIGRICSLGGTANKCNSNVKVVLPRLILKVEEASLKTCPSPIRSNLTNTIQSIPHEFELTCSSAELGNQDFLSLP
ncbi:hypothetical protein OUZ56_020848 [Daphnia magna]|uniref:Uncharacterized protein n=1 Tax=Daphnia magna TaxID=35525 RepID=A0ABQ9ZFM2_9CRUS|nr:hypothetical protein OUZ56_020848 [Daphnia magna]